MKRMKLIEILYRDWNGVWPFNKLAGPYTCVVQSMNGEVSFHHANPVYNTTGWYGSLSMLSVEKHQLANDYQTAIITQKDFEEYSMKQEQEQTPSIDELVKTVRESDQMIKELKKKKEDALRILRKEGIALVNPQEEFGLMRVVCISDEVPSLTEGKKYEVFGISGAVSDCGAYRGEQYLIVDDLGDKLWYSDRYMDSLTN